MKKWLETGILLLAAAGFWGMVYPDLCFVQDVCKVEYVSAEAQGEESRQGEGGRSAAGEEGLGIAPGAMGEADLYTRICEAEPGQVKIKSRLLEFFRK